MAHGFGSGQSETGCQHDWVEVLFWASEVCLNLHMAEGARERCVVSFVRALVPFMRFYPHDLITSRWLHCLIL